MTQKFYISNAFALSMLPGSAMISAIPVTAEEARQLLREAENRGLEVASVIGHADTAAVVSGLLGRTLAPNRVNLLLGSQEPLLVAQYVGPRLPEGATQLPEGATIHFWAVMATLTPRFAVQE